MDGELHVRSLRQALTRVQRRLRRLLGEGPSPADELVAERRVAAHDE